MKASSQNQWEYVIWTWTERNRRIKDENMKSAFFREAQKKKKNCGSEGLLNISHANIFIIESTGKWVLL